MQYQAVLFDMDGVLFDSEPLHYEATRAVFGRQGHDLAHQAYMRHFGGQTDELGFRQYGTLIGISEADATRLAQEKASEFLTIASTEQLVPCPGVIQTLHDLNKHSVPLALVTGSLRHEAELVINTFGLDNIFTVILTANEISQSKPHPEGYLTAAAALNVEPLDCVVIEDAPSGIQAANAAGMRCIAVTTTYPRHELTAAMHITDQLRSSAGRLQIHD